MATLSHCSEAINALPGTVLPATGFGFTAGGSGWASTAAATNEQIIQIVQRIDFIER
jgi:hypothetical protein